MSVAPICGVNDSDPFHKSHMVAAKDMETTESMLFQEQTDSQPASQRSASTAPLGQAQDVCHPAVPRPRSSLGFRHPSARGVGLQRGILDELCARRELPFKSVDEPEQPYRQDKAIKKKMTLSSSPGDKASSSDSDPFGGSAMSIPAARAVGKLSIRAKRPRSSSSGLVMRRPTRLPSRSPDIFDRMSSSPPSGREHSSDEEQAMPLRFRRAEAKVPALGDDLSDTDVEDSARKGKRSRRPSSGTTSGEHAPPSSTSTLRTMMFLATPMNKLESDDAVALATDSATAGRSLRFVSDGADASVGKKRKLELAEEDKENTAASVPSSVIASAKSVSARPALNRIASLDYYAGSPAKRSCSLGAEARRLSQIVSKYQQKSSPLDEAELHLDAVSRPRHALGEIKANRKLNGTSSAHQLGKGRLASGPIAKYASDKGQLGLASAPCVTRSLSAGNLQVPPRATEAFTSGGGTEDEECARLLLGLGSSR